jgi:hypothetical protein
MTWRRLLAVTMLLAAPLNATARLTEIAKDFVSRTKTFSATRIMVPPTASGSYLMSLFINQPSGSSGNITATLRWTDEQGPQSRSLALLNNGLPQGMAFPVRIAANTKVTVETTGTVGTSYDLFVRGIGFWIPAAGKTSLTSHHTDLLHWINASYPNLQSVVTAPGIDASYLIRLNFDEIPNSASDVMCVDITSTDEYSRSQTQTACANPNGVPTMMVFPLRVKAGTTVQLVTYHFAPPKWGASPPYNLTVDVIGF